MSDMFCCVRCQGWTAACDAGAKFSSGWACRSCAESQELKEDDYALGTPTAGTPVAITSSSLLLAHTVPEPPGNLTLNYNAHNLRFEPNGDIFLNDRKLTTDTEIVDGMRALLGMAAVEDADVPVVKEVKP